MVPEREKTVRKPEEPAKKANLSSRGFALPTLSDNSVTDSGPRAEFVETKRSREVMQRPGKDASRMENSPNEAKIDEDVTRFWQGG